MNSPMQWLKESAWKSPMEGQIKINIYAGWTGLSSTGFSFIARAHVASMVVAATHLESSRMDPTVAEAMALRWSLAMINE